MKCFLLSLSAGVPVIGAEPELVELYSTHSGCSKLFEAAGVTMPPAVDEVHSLEQLTDHLASLITANLSVRRWLFKIDHYPRGRGFGEYRHTVSVLVSSWCSVLRCSR